jgi:aminoglycoside 6'-N-acetyltransferase
LKLVENIPLNTQIIADLIKDPADLHLVWPIARYPFDHDQWRSELDPDDGHTPFLIYHENNLIGHAALRKTEVPLTYAVSFLYLLPGLRSKGLGEKLVGLLEEFSIQRLSAKQLILVTRTYNPAAIKCYTKCGFREYEREGTLIKMSKHLVDPEPEKHENHNGP